MTFLWIYNLPLKPESGGTERITSLVAKGFALRGHYCMDILVFDEHNGMMSYRSEPVVDLYGFLKEHGVDVVINQIAYSNWLLDTFLDKGGEKWRQEGGKLISCLHFDPKNLSLLHRQVSYIINHSYSCHIAMELIKLNGDILHIVTDERTINYRWEQNAN